MIRASLAAIENVGEEAADEPGADRGPAHGAHHRLRAIDQIVDEVARLLPDVRARVEIVDVLLDHGEIAARGERLAGAAEDRRRDALVRVDVAPEARELAVHPRVGGIELARVRHGRAQHPRVRAVELEALVVAIAVGHGRPPGMQAASCCAIMPQKSTAPRRDGRSSASGCTHLKDACRAVVRPSRRAPSGRSSGRGEFVCGRKI